MEKRATDIDGQNLTRSVRSFEWYRAPVYGLQVYLQSNGHLKMVTRIRSGEETLETDSWRFAEHVKKRTGDYLVSCIRDWQGSGKNYSPTFKD